MAKQRCICLNKDDLANLLKQRFGWLPDDLEICSVEQLQRSTIIAITVHSDEFKPLPSNFTHLLHGFNLTKDDWDYMEQRYQETE